MLDFSKYGCIFDPSKRYSNGNFETDSRKQQHRKSIKEDCK